jgi:hypothetical protein
LGTTARFLVGVALLALGAIAGGHWIAWWQLALGLVGLPAAVVATQAARLAFTRRSLTQTGRLASCVNCALLFVLLVYAPTRNATLVFLGASMLLAAARGYGGCESLAISNWLLAATTRWAACCSGRWTTTRRGVNVGPREWRASTP